MKKLLLVLLVLPALCPAGPDSQWLDVNRWLVIFHNDGRWGYDPSGGGGTRAAASWPQPYRNMYVFGAGPWVGSIVDNDTLVTVGYNPNSGTGEFGTTLCRYWRAPDPLDRIYKHPGDWPPPRERFPMAPQEALADMQLWCAFGDSNPANHVPPGRPLGVDIYLTVFGFSDSPAEDFFFLKYELANAGPDELRNTYFGLALDADIGHYSDDMTGLLLNDTVAGVGRVRDVGFAGDYDNDEPPSNYWEEGVPGVIAVKLLQAPDGLGLTAFKNFTIEIDPVTDPDQYLTMAGYDYRTGVYSPYDSIDLVPADKRFLMTTGPFDLAPDSVVTFWYAVIGAPYGGPGQTWPNRKLPYNDSLAHLARQCRQARQRFERMLGIAEHEAPGIRTPRPTATIIRGSLFLGAGLGTPGAGHNPIPPGESGLCPKPVLLDISGRKVMDLQPGENDVRHLAPGVYFIRAPLWERSPDPPAEARAGRDFVRKVVIQK